MKGGYTQPNLHTQKGAATFEVRLGTHLDSLTSILSRVREGPTQQVEGTYASHRGAYDGATNDAHPSV